MLFDIALSPPLAEIGKRTAILPDLGQDLSLVSTLRSLSMEKRAARGRLGFFMQDERTRSGKSR